MKRVTGLGGVFFKCNDPDEVREWYQRHLGLQPGHDGSADFRWREVADPSRQGRTLWGPFTAGTEYFGPSGQSYMVNFRVENLEALIATLRQEGVEIAGGPEFYPGAGWFAWIIDVEGHRVELWQPIEADERGEPGAAE
jgi:predicted enzyme related to lactoylglutathione lyase